MFSWLRLAEAERVMSYPSIVALSFRKATTTELFLSSSVYSRQAVAVRVFRTWSIFRPNPSCRVPTSGRGDGFGRSGRVPWPCERNRRPRLGLCGFVDFSPIFCKYRHIRVNISLKDRC